MTLDTTTHTTDNDSVFAGIETETATTTADTAATVDTQVPALEQAAPDEEVAIIPLSKIHKREGHNPRRYRSKKDMDERRESIRAKGVIQAILVRPHPTLTGEYELVAGENRVDLSLDVGLTTIPALIRKLTDADLLDFASTENIQRASMSPIDEGQAAQNLLAEGKSEEEVCLILGWKPAFLKGRIQLTHCTPLVAQALVDEEISLGHAQRLSSLRAKSQEAALESIKKHSLTVEQLSAGLDANALRLDAAAFDVSDCQQCPHNSSTQVSLFADSQSMKKAKCLNSDCFNKKTTTHMDGLKADLEESHHKVAFVTEVAAGTTTVIIPTGPHGVGEEQVTACQGCEHFGATIDNKLGSKGAITQNVCFNLPCHTTKVAEYRNVIATDATPAQENKGATPAPEKTETGKATGTPASAQGKTKDTKAPSKPKVEKTAKVAKSAIPKKIVDQHHQVHRTAAAAFTLTDDKTILIVSLLSLMAEANVEPDKKPEGWPMSLSGDNRAKAAAMLATLEIEQLTALQRRIAAKVIQKAKSGYSGENEKDSFGSVAHWIAKTQKLDLSKHWKMDSEYLDAFTKPMITTRLEESGFSAAYDKANTEGSFKKLANGKKGDLIDEVKAFNFDFTGYLPEGLSLTE